ncbi:hypothetical protein [Kitasatospora sp. NPDC002040]|uniref:hypothetical protein n=1 Tax=Kitasatospora sp. NPDC002040 TaxID=3154661 RepID=UPI00332EB2E7
MPETPSTDDQNPKLNVIALTLSGSAEVERAAIDGDVEADAIINLPITGEPR